jgi:hypothetical protein
VAPVSTPALDAAQRQALERAIGRGRRLLEDDLATQAEGRFGIYASGVVDDEESLRLDPSALADRREVVDVVAHLHDQGESEEEAVAHLIREAAFTHLNRLVAIRIAEAIDLLPPSLTAGKASQGFRDLMELAPSLAADETGGYWTYLRLCGDELAGDAPALFDPRNPLLRLAPSPAALDELVEVLSDSTLADAWGAPDALGWTYQFFNSAEERRKMREESAAPRNSRELAVRNQFFTPRYVVDFLVHNTLGRRLVESDVSSPLRDELDYLVDLPEEPGAPLQLDEVKILDPACGSGHFLLGAYDVLERAWELQGVSAEDAAPRILLTLWGIDIDPRCAQVASATLVLRARRHCRKAPLPRPNVITARALPEAPEAWDKVLAALPADRRKLVEEIRDALVDAPVLGSLLKVEERLADAITRVVPETKAEEGTLFAATGVASDRFGQVEGEILTALQGVADEASSSAAERLLAAEAGDAIRFIEAVRQRYDAVLMNPPFGEPIPGTKDYLKAVYPWMPSKDVNLLAAFVGRGIELLAADGYIGAITSRAALFLITFRQWREDVLLRHELKCAADLGAGVMEQALVEAAAYVVGARTSRASDVLTFIDVVASDNKPADLRRDGLQSEAMRAAIFRVPLGNFKEIPGVPLAYWLAASFRRLFDEYARVGDVADVRQGLSTADDFRFIRLAWEIDSRRVRTTPERDSKLSPWVPLAKGGEFSPYWLDIHLLINWGDGSQLSQSSGAVIRNRAHYFLPGITWSRRSQAGFSPRVLPAGCIFSDRGPTAFLSNITELWLLLGWLNSTMVARLLEALTTFGSFDVGAIQRCPWIASALDPARRERLSAMTSDLAGLLAAIDLGVENTRRFTRPSVIRAGVVSLEDVAERARTEQAEIQARCSELHLTIQAEFASAIKEEAQPESPRLNFPQLSTSSAVAETISYLVGCAFGRWDIRIGTDPTLASPLPDLFDPVPVCPPGMLVGRDGMPANVVPDGYPLQLPPGRILLDEPGHAWDLDEAVRRAASFLFDDPDAILLETEHVLGTSAIRDYLRKQFFKDHLSRYSKSRRKAPIYWHLSVPSRRWGLWLYVPNISREMLFAVAREAARREAISKDAVNRLQGELASTTGTAGRKLSTQLDAEEKLAEELRVFRAEADRIAALGWEPDLDDGIILCAAPLADLFPAWLDAAKERANLRNGSYPWASVSAFAGEI